MVSISNPLLCCRSFVVAGGCVLFDRQKSTYRGGYPQIGYFFGGWVPPSNYGPESRGQITNQVSGLGEKKNKKKGETAGLLS